MSVFGKKWRTLFIQATNCSDYLSDYLFKTYDQISNVLLKDKDAVK